MRYNSILKHKKFRKQIDDFISFRTLRAFPCPFCHCTEVTYQKSDVDSYDKTDIRVTCKYCQRVENFLYAVILPPLQGTTDEATLRINNYRTCLFINDEVFLDVHDNKYVVTDNKHRSKFELEPFCIDYSNINKLINKIEVLTVFK